MGNVWLWHATQPPLAVLDEPTSNLDAAAGDCRSYCAKKQGKTCFYRIVWKSGKCWPTGALLEGGKLSLTCLAELATAWGYPHPQNHYGRTVRDNALSLLSAGNASRQD
jgi:hypothetical protein